MTDTKKIIDTLDVHSSILAELLETVRELSSKVDLLTVSIPDVKGSKGTKLGKEHGNTVVDEDEAPTDKKKQSYNKKNFFNQLYLADGGKAAILAILKTIKVPQIVRKEYLQASAFNPDKGAVCYKFISDSPYSQLFFIKLREHFDNAEEEEPEPEPVPETTPAPVKKALTKTKKAPEPEVKKKPKKPVEETDEDDDDAEFSS